MTIFKRHRFNIQLFLISTLVGLAVGVVTVPYRFLLEKSVLLRDYIYKPDNSLFFHLLVIAGMWGIAMLIYYAVKRYPNISGSGIPQVEGFLCGRYKLLQGFKQMILKLLGSAAGIGMGFSLGREGPSVQSGAFIAGSVSKLFKVNPSDERFLITGGAAAGLAAIFNAPLSSTIFASESIAKYQSPKIILTVLLAAIPSAWLATAIFTDNPYAFIDTFWPDQNSFYILLPILIGLALFMAASGKLFNTLLLYFQKHYGRGDTPSWLKVLAIVLLTYLIGMIMPDILAGGDPLIFKYAKEGGTIWLIAVIFIVKIFITAFCYALGFPGGVFMPLLVIGALGGKLFLLLLCELGLPYQDYSGFFMIISMAAMFTASVQSPITGLVLVPEMTGHFNMFFPMVVLIGFTFFFSRIMGVEPIYKRLYATLLPDGYQNPDDVIVNHYEIYETSYLIGKTIDQVTLPQGATLISFTRDGALSYDDNTPLQQRDIIQISIISPEVENLHKAIMSLCKY